MISKIDIIGCEKIPEQKILPLIKTNLLFSEQNLKSQIQSILSYYGNNGFPFTQIEPKDFYANDTAHTVSFTLKIDEGPYVKIHDLKLQGTPVSNARIKQLIRFKANQPYSAYYKNKILQKIESQNLNVLDYQILEFDTNYLLQVDVKEKNNQTITGAVSYLPSQKEFNGFFNFDFNNLFSSLRKTQIGWEKTGKFTNFMINYYDPYLLGFKINLNGNHNINDTIYAKTNFNSDIGLDLSDLFSLNFILSYDQTATTIQNLSSFQTFWIGQGFTLNYMNQPEYKINFNTMLGTRNQTAQTQIISRTSVESQIFISSKNISFLNDIIFRNLYSKYELSISDSLYLGGTRTLRGFKENEFATDRFILTRNEFSFFRNKNINAFMLADIAYLNFSPHNLFKLGYGIGLNVKSRTSSAELSYAIPYPNNLLQGKIHLKLSNSF